MMENPSSESFEELVPKPYLGPTTVKSKEDQGPPTTDPKEDKGKRKILILVSLDKGVQVQLLTPDPRAPLPCARNGLNPELLTTSDFSEHQLSADPEG